MLGVSIVLFVVLLAVLFAVAAVTAGFGDLMRPVFQDARPVGLPATKVTPDDLEALRFNVVLRGYKMTEVDAVLHRMAREIAERDAVLAELRGEGRPVSFRPPPPTEAWQGSGVGEAPTELLAPYPDPVDGDASTAHDPAVQDESSSPYAVAGSGDLTTEPEHGVDHEADTDEHEAVPDWSPEEYRTLHDQHADAPTELIATHEQTEPVPTFREGETTSTTAEGTVPLDESGRPSDQGDRTAPPAPPADPS